jgi:hypothetical protein
MGGDASFKCARFGFIRKRASFQRRTFSAQSDCTKRGQYRFEDLVVGFSTVPGRKRSIAAQQKLWFPFRHATILVIVLYRIEEASRRGTNCTIVFLRQLRIRNYRRFLTGTPFLW